MITIGQKRGYFITFEGMDGAGKTDHAALLRQALRDAGFKVSAFRSPGTTKLGEKIRDIVKSKKNNVCDAAELLLMNADRAQLVEEKIKPALEAGEIVICDRYLYSTIVYQGFGRQIDMNIVKAVTQYAVGDVVPDLTFVLTISKEIEAQRKAKRGVTDRFEAGDVEFQARLRQGYEWLANMEKESKGKLINIDTSGKMESTHNEILRCASYRISCLEEGQLTLANKIITSI